MTRPEADAEKIRCALDACLSGVDALPSQRAEIMRRARGEQIVKKKISTGMALVFVMLALIVGATAMGVNSGLINWQGEQETDDRYLLSAPPDGENAPTATETTAFSVIHPAVTATPTPQPEEAEQTGNVQYFRTLDPVPYVTPTTAPASINTDTIGLSNVGGVGTVGMFKDIKSGETLYLGQASAAAEAGTVKVVLSTSADGTVNQSVQTSLATLYSYDDFCAALADQTSLPLPSGIPEGYTFAAGQIQYSCTTNTVYSLTSVEILENGAVVQHYHPANASAVFPSGYTLILSGRGGSQLLCNVVLHDDYEGMRFDLWEQESSEHITVPGMTDALTITGVDRNRLYMHKPLGAEIEYITQGSFISVGNNGHGIDTYNEVAFSLYATDLSTEELIALYPAE